MKLLKEMNMCQWAHMTISIEWLCNLDFVFLHPVETHFLVFGESNKASSYTPASVTRALFRISISYPLIWELGLR